MAAGYPFALTSIDLQVSKNEQATFNVKTGIGNSIRCLANVSFGPTHFVGTRITTKNLTGQMPVDAHVMLLIHGFNTQPAEILDHANQVQAYMQQEHAELNLCVVPLLWPCADRFFDKIDNYHEDRKNGEMTGIFLRRWLADENKALGKIHSIMSHSMGNWVLQNVFRTPPPDPVIPNSTRQPVPLVLDLKIKLFMVAADVDHDIFSDSYPTPRDLDSPHESDQVMFNAKALVDSVQKVFVFFSRDDEALKFSESVLHRQERLGRRALEMELLAPTIRDKLLNFDATASSAADFPVGHSYFTAPAFLDLIAIQLGKFETSA